MKKTQDEKIPHSAKSSDARDDWYFEELMTSQPEATREFFRAKLLASTKRNGPREAH